MAAFGKLPLLVAGFGFLALSSGCALTPEANGASHVESSEEELVSCDAAKYNEALAHYKNAVAWSKDRNAKGVCGSAYGLLWPIADEASRAVMTCGAFRETIKTSPWAEPLRIALGPSLTLRSLTGELLVIKDSPYQNWNGSERFFDQGLSFWARAEGAYGPAVRIDFRAGGEATYGYLHYDEPTGDITWQTTPATYSVTKIDERAVGKRRVVVEHGGVTDTFTLGVDDPLEYSAAPIFTLTPDEGSKAPKLFSLVSECDA